MSDPLPTDNRGALDGASESDRDAKIEQLLLVGLDHYFSGEYEQAINVWSRALFIDRSHARARAYIERARSAVAERQRESEEMLQKGVAAFERGEAGEARRLLQTAIGRGVPSDEALAVLDRLDRLEQGAVPQRQAGGAREERSTVIPAARVRSAAAITLRITTWIAAIALIAAAAGVAVISLHPDWRSLLVLETAPGPLPVLPGGGATHPLPARGEELLERARALEASGHLREAMAALDQVRLTDPQKADADRIRGDVQKTLIQLASPGPASAEPEGVGPREP